MSSILKICAKMIDYFSEHNKTIVASAHTVFQQDKSRTVFCISMISVFSNSFSYQQTNSLEEYIYTMLHCNSH